MIAILSAKMRKRCASIGTRGFTRSRMGSVLITRPHRTRARRRSRRNTHGVPSFATAISAKGLARPRRQNICYRIRSTTYFHP